MIKTTLKICFLFISIVNTFAFNEVVFNLNFDECNTKRIKKYRDYLKILIEFNNCKILKSPEYSIIQDGIEIGDITENKDIKIIFKKNKAPTTFRVYARSSNNLQFIGFFENKKSKIYINLNNKMFWPAKTKKLFYNFIDDDVISAKKHRKTSRRSKITKNDTSGENPLEEGQIQENCSSTR